MSEQYKYTTDESLLYKTRTFITYDNCNKWDYLSINNQTLNLHSYASYAIYDIPPIMTSSYGTLIGNGDVGDNLDYANVNTYHSNNAGKNITQVYNYLY
jgi:hypothetical protein